MSERGMLDQALAYAAAGWPVFPCAPGAKVPVFPRAHPPDDPCRGECGQAGHGLYDATTDPHTITEWWGPHPDRNVAIATGAPGPDVLDVDRKPDGSGFAALNELLREGLAGGYRAIVRTPSGGLHLYYPGSDQGNGRLKSEFLDFRGRGGYVVAPPSMGDQGRGYEVVKHEPGGGTPVSWRAIREHLAPEPERSRASRAACEAGRGDEGRIERLAGFVADGVPGDRNFRVFYAAKQAAIAGQLDGAAVERLVSAARDAGLRGGEAEARRSIASGQRSALEAVSPVPFARQPDRGREAG
jgi:hypothetical protein